MLDSVRIVLKKCMGLKKDESVLIVTDSELYDIGKVFFEEAKKISENCKLVKIPIPEVHGMEPPKDVSEDMQKHDVEILVTVKSLSHTAARKNASKTGARITTLPGITAETMKRAIDVDYDRLKEMTSKISSILSKGDNVKITTKAGTYLNFSIKGRECQGDDSGIYDKKGSFGNLPSGEAFLAPVEKTCNGTYVVDASFGGIGKLNSPIKVVVKDGYAVDFFGEDAGKLKEILEKFGKEAGNIAELGIGTNANAIITGDILEDEKVFGTCHIALGNNSGFGGKVDVPIHLDGIIKNPTIYVDNKKIMDDGKLIV